MAKHKPKAAKQVELKAWLSANQDSRDGRFIQLGNSFLFSERVKSLKSGAFRLYICMAMEAGGRREFKFPKSAALKYGITYTSYRRYLTELIKCEFISCKQNNWNLREENVYQFNFGWKE